jgi:hypothetical protein
MDMHLLASSWIDNERLWIEDKCLRGMAIELDIEYNQQ